MLKQTESKNKEFLKKKVFVPTNLTPGIERVMDNRSDAVVGWVIGILTIDVLTWFLTKERFKDLTNIPYFMSLCIYTVLFVLLGCFIIAVFVYHVDQKVSQRSIEGKSVHNTSLNEVCSIEAGGIRLEEFGTGISGLIINYRGCPALLYSVINDSTDGLAEGAVQLHYALLQRVIDTVMQADALLYKYNIKYNTENDPIWDYTINRINSVSSDLGQDYVRVMGRFLDHIYGYTLDHSMVSVTYHVIKMKSNTSISEIVNLYNQLNHIYENSIAKIRLLDFKEFQRLVETLYCRSTVDLTKILPKTSIIETEGDSKILVFMDETTHKYKKAGEETKINIVKNFYDNIYTEQPVKEVHKEKVLQNLDIFSDM